MKSGNEFSWTNARLSVEILPLLSDYYLSVTFRLPFPFTLTHHSLVFILFNNVLSLFSDCIIYLYKLLGCCTFATKSFSILGKFRIVSDGKTQNICQQTEMSHRTMRFKILVLQIPNIHHVSVILGQIDKAKLFAPKIALSLFSTKNMRRVM